MRPTKAMFVLFALVMLSVTLLNAQTFVTVKGLVTEDVGFNAGAVPAAGVLVKIYLLDPSTGQRVFLDRLTTYTGTDGRYDAIIDLAEYPIRDYSHVIVDLSRISGVSLIAPYQLGDITLNFVITGFF